jgi:hypothetical protein
MDNQEIDKSDKLDKSDEAYGNNLVEVEDWVEKLRKFEESELIILDILKMAKETSNELSKIPNCDFDKISDLSIHYLDKVILAQTSIKSLNTQKNNNVRRLDEISLLSKMAELQEIALALDEKS